MKVEHVKLENTLDWGDGRHIAELVIESPEFLRMVLRDLSSNADEKQLCFVSSAGRILDFSKEVNFISNPLQLDFNNKQAIATLIRLLSQVSVAEERYLDTNKLKTKIVKYINELVDAENFLFEVDVNDFSMGDIAKAVGLRIVDDEDDFVEMLTDYMTMMIELAGIKVFVFLNLRMLLSGDELKRFVRNLNNREIDVLLIEGKDFGRIKDVKQLVVDVDLCEI